MNGYFIKQAQVLRPNRDTPIKTSLKCPLPVLEDHTALHYSPFDSLTLRISTRSLSTSILAFSKAPKPPMRSVFVLQRERKIVIQHRIIETYIIKIMPRFRTDLCMWCWSRHTKFNTRLNGNWAVAFLRGHVYISGILMVW